MIKRAADFAQRAHGAQTRKYTHEPYWHHPERVAAIVATVTDDPQIIAAAWLHDVIEDTHYTRHQIARAFNSYVAKLVWWLSDQSKPADGNRAARKAIDRQHIALAPPEAKTIKLADLIDNTHSITHHDPDFAKVYLAEKRLLLPVLKQGHYHLWYRARILAADYESVEAL